MQANTTTIRIQSVKLISKFLKIMSDSDLIPIPESNSIFLELKHLAEHGENRPPVPVKLWTQEEAAVTLGVSLSNFKKLEREGAFSFKRKMVGTSVRYRNLDIINYILASDDSSPSDPANG